MMNKLVVNAEIQHRALKLRIYPTKEQEILINKTGRAKKSPQDSQKSSGLSWRLRLRSATRKIHIRPIPEPS
ncbi:helix-turn-helix domain-containing protein [Treponema saccharophilum]|uniref:helix-turn-helix domain-containing protein n=1 Tax=Treponema saccharophilum TaxID=165 RepID=UPI00386E1AB0